MISSNVMANNDSITKKLKDIASYPSAEKNQNRNVIWLPKKSNESQYRVEILASKKGIVDCNTRNYGAEFDDKILEGWGYHYYVIKNITEPGHTLMLCLNLNYKKAQSKIGKIPVSLRNLPIPYISELPIVVYAPKDVTIEYRIWETKNSVKTAQVEN